MKSEFEEGRAAMTAETQEHGSPPPECIRNAYGDFKTIRKLLGLRGVRCDFETP